MNRRLGILGAFAVLCGAIVGLFVTWPDGDATDVPEVAPAPEPSRPDPRDDHEVTSLERIDAEIAFHERRASSGGSWMDWESVALQRMARQRLSGDYHDFAEAERALEAAFTSAPRGSGPVFGRMQLNFTLHRLDAVEADVAATEGQVMLRADETLALRTYRAEIAFYRGQYDVALPLYEALAHDDRSVTSLVSLAQYHWRTGDLSQADALLTEAGTVARSSERAWLCLVRALFEIAREGWDAAEAAIEAGLTASPGWWQLEEHQAQVHFERGELDEARAIYESIYARAPSPEMLDALAVLALEQGRRSDASDLSARAEAMHEERIALFPEAAAGHALDHFLLLSDRTERAIELAEINATARPFGEAQGKLAIAYARAGRWDDALEVVTALEATPWSTAESHAIAALVHAQTGDTGRAADHREAAVALAPGAVGRVEAILRGR